MPDDWYRSDEWSDDAQEDFERRLARSRGHTRPQYLRIKGLALHESGQVEAARRLWERVLQCEDDFDHAFALELLGDSWATTDVTRAAGFYRRSIDDYPDGSTTGTVEVKLAEMLIARGGPEDLAGADRLLEAWTADDPVPFPSAHFRSLLGRIAIAQAAGDEAAVRSFARAALEAAEAGPVFESHPTVGVVESDELTLRRLERLAR